MVTVDNFLSTTELKLFGKHTHFFQNGFIEITKKIKVMIIDKKFAQDTRFILEAFSYI